MISIICPTYRPGGFDVLARSLSLTKGQYELILVDDFPGRVERGTVVPYLESFGVKVGWYGPSKPKCYPDTKGGVCNAVNTGLLHARGDYIILLSDYCMLPVNWADQWEKAREIHGDKSLISGGAMIFDCPKPTARHDVLTWEHGIPSMSPKCPWVPKVFETFYCMVPRCFWSETNGMDERADHCHAWFTSSLVAQAGLLGYELVVEQTITVFMIDHRVWDSADEQAPWGEYDGLWRITASRSVEEEPVWGRRSPNPGFQLPGVGS